jgi:hypothetical protein
MCTLLFIQADHGKRNKKCKKNLVVNIFLQYLAPKNCQSMLTGHKYNFIGWKILPRISTTWSVLSPSRRSTCSEKRFFTLHELFTDRWRTTMMGNYVVSLHILRHNFDLSVQFYLTTYIIIIVSREYFL